MSVQGPSPPVALSERIPLLALAVVTLLVAGVVLWLFEPSKINPDTIQLIDTARQLVNGHGLSSSIVYYEEQLAFGSVPAPMTVWPPGFPWLLAVGMSVGFSPESTALALCLTAHLGVAFLIYFGLRRAETSASIAATAGCVWLLHPTGLSLTISCFAEPIFIAFMLASCLALIEALGDSPRWRLWLFISGACAAGAVLIRYNGVLWPAAAGLWLTFRAWRRSSWRTFGIAVAFGVLPALTTLGLLWRNVLLSGHLSGGQFEYGGAAGVVEAMRRFYWGTDLLFGSLLTAQPIVLTLVFCVLGVELVQAVRKGGLMEPRNLLLGFALASGAVLAVFLFANALRSSIVFVDYRYWIPAIPFLLIVVSAVADRALTKLQASQNARARLWPSVVALSTGTLIISISVALAGNWPLTQPHRATAVVRRALTEHLPDGRTLGAMLTASSDAPRLLLSNEERRLGFATGIPVVGLPIARYTQNVWDTHSVAALIRKFGISHVLFFPTTYQEEYSIPFYGDLQGGRPPDWLTLRFRGELVELYEVVPQKLAQQDDNAPPRAHVER